MNGLYLSRIFFDHRNRNTWKLLQSPYRMHAAIMRAFPEQKACKAGVLFRIERELKNSIPVLVQSQLEPRWNNLVKEYGDLVWFDSVKDISGIGFTTGQRLKFCLRANPVVTKKDIKGRLNKKGLIKSCRLPILIESKQLEWINSKGKVIRKRKDGTSVPGGFSVSQCLIMNEPAWMHKKQGQKEPIKIKTVMFQGILQVTEPEAFFQNTVVGGVGPAKAFGCGLLSVAKA